MRDAGFWERALCFCGEQAFFKERRRQAGRLSLVVAGYPEALLNQLSMRGAKERGIESGVGE